MAYQIPAAAAGFSDPSKSTLWMGELEPWMDENYVRQLWASMGESVSVKMIRDKLSGSNAGYCFVDFMNPAGAMKYLSTLNGTIIPGTTRVFRLNWASGGTATAMTSGGVSMDRGPEYSLFVGDLANEVTDFMLLQAFQSRYLTCKSAKVVTDPITTMSRGYGFVRFSDEAEQQRALAEMQGQFCGTRAMRLSLATPKNNPGGAVPTSPTGGAAFAPPPPQQQQQPPYYPQAAQAQQMPPAGVYNQFSDPTNTTVFVGGLNTQIADEELRSYFAPFGEVVYTKIPPGKGCGFVQFVHRQSAEMAIAQMNGFLIGGSRVRLSWGRSQAIPKSDYRPLSAGPYGGAGAYPPFHQQGYSQHYGHQPHHPAAASHLHPHHPQLPPQPPALPQDPREPVPVDRANREFLARKERAALDQSVGVQWRRLGVHA